MTGQHFISLSPLQKVINFHHLSYSKIAAITHLDEKILKGKKPIHISLFFKILVVIRRELGDDLAGMIKGFKMTEGSHVLIGRACVNTNTLLHFIKRGYSFHEKMAPPLKVEVAETEQLLNVYFVIDDSKLVEPFLMEVLIIIWVQFGRWACDRNIKLESVWFGHNIAPDSLNSATFYGCKPNFNANKYGFSFSKKWKDAPVVKSDDDYSELIRNLTGLFQQKKIDLSDVKSSVVNLFKRNRKPASLSAEKIASILGITPQLMRRKLSEQNTNFNDLKQMTIIHVAFDLLQNTNLTPTEIADNLGYGEISSFYRQFKKITGVTPKQYRDRFKTAI